MTDGALYGATVSSCPIGAGYSPFEQFSSEREVTMNHTKNVTPAQGDFTGNDGGRQKQNLRGRFVNVPGLAEHLGVKPSWVYDRTGPSSKDRIPHFKMGKYVRFDIESEEFNQWRDRNFRK
jgi:hypothetical protein